MAIQIEGNQIQDGVISFAKLLSSDIETTLTGSSSKLARADAVKAYVDNIAAGIHWKDSVKVATTANITLSGEQTIDGITTSSSRVLVKNQTDASQNGIWVSASGAWARATDMNESAEFAGSAVFVREGTSQEDTGYVCTNDSDPVVGTDDITFAQFTGAANIVAGDGLDKTGSTLSVNVDGSSLEIATDSLQIKALGVTNAMLAGGIANAKLLNSTISGVALGSNLSSMSVVTGSALSMTSYNGSAASSDLAVQVDDSSVEISSNALRVKASGITNAMLAGSITSDRLQTGAALGDDAGALIVKVDNSTIEVESVANALRIKDSGVTNAKLANSTISGVSLGGTLNALSVVSGSGLTMTSYNGSAARSDLAISVDDSSIEIATNSLQIKALGVTNAMLAGSIGADKLAGSIPADKLNLGTPFAEVGGDLSLASGVAGSGLSLTSQILAVNVDGSSLEIATDSLQIKALGVTNAMLAGSIEASKLAGSIPADKLNLGNGVQDNGGNLQVDLEGSTLALGVNGLKVADAGIDEAQLADEAVKPAKCGFFSQWDVLSPNGSLTAFDLSYTIDQTFASIIVIRNGLVLKQVASSPSSQDEFSLSLTGGAGGVSRITFGAAPTNGSDLRVWYMA